MPGFDGKPVLEFVEAEVGGGEHFGQHDYLTGVHRNGKRNLNRFPIFVSRLSEFQLTASDGFGIVTSHADLCRQLEEVGITKARGKPW
jgi:hypothetical protein